MKYISILLLMCTCQFQFTELEPTTKTAQYKKVKSDSKLNGNIISKHEDVTLLKCAAFGLRNQTYRALNYYSTHLDTGTCEVLSTDRRSASLVTANGYTYYERQTLYPDLCISNPCLHTGICNTIDTDNGRDFMCDCPFPLGGKTCADLICGSCQRENDLVIFWNITTDMTWIQSYTYCRNLGNGASLYLDKNKAKHDLATSIAKKVFPNNKEQVCFWIGMNKTANKWTYVDGTKLTSSYNAWSDSRPQTETCVEIANTADFNWKWDDESCIGDPTGGWKYYPLCENTYSFLLK